MLDINLVNNYNEQKSQLTTLLNGLYDVNEHNMNGEQIDALGENLGELKILFLIKNDNKITKEKILNVPRLFVRAMSIQM